jgi:YidC/Oxa1 family membrane protein insertase
MNDILAPLEEPLRAYLKFLHVHVGLTWAFAIIVLTLSVRLVMVPLTVKSQISMRRMADLQPEIKKLKDEHGHDKQLLNQKMMDLYKTERVNPFASCLPLILQAPIFIALYYVLRHANNLVKPGDDLSFLSNGFVRDITASLRHQAGSPPTWALVLMLVLYVGSQVGATLVTPTTMQGSQKAIMAAAPIVFVFFIINGHFPVGLLLYWITTNLFTLLQAVVIRVFFPPPQYVAAKEEARKKAEALSAARGPNAQQPSLMSRLRRETPAPVASTRGAANNTPAAAKARGASLSKKQVAQKQGAPKPAGENGAVTTPGAQKAGGQKARGQKQVQRAARRPAKPPKPAKQAGAGDGDG